LTSLIVIAGPTGVGKSELALRIALARRGEIVNFDSVQVYRGFDVGSAKPSIELRASVPHHLYDVVDPGDPFDAADYARLARAACEDIAGRGNLSILVGGTFFYLRALLSGLPAMPGRDDRVRERIRGIASRPRGPERLHRWLSRVDPQSGKRIAPADRHRVERALEVWIATGSPISTWQRPVEEIPSVKIALRLERQPLVAALDARVERMYADGLVDETRRLLERYPGDARPFGAIGYREAAAVVAGELGVNDAMTETKRRTRAYAKRQMTWLRAEPGVRWIDATNPEQTFAAAMRLIEDLF